MGARAASVLFLAILAGLGMFYVVTRPRGSLPIPPSLVGCYIAHLGARDFETVIAPEGLLRHDGLSTRVVLAEDKEGRSFLPDKRFFFDPALGEPILDSAAPNLLRIAPDGRSFAVPDGLMFRKTDCPAGA